MDVWINFKHATKWQAEGIFKCFFPARPSAAPVPAAAAASAPDADARKHPGDATSGANLAESKRKRAAGHSIPLLSEEEISELAKRFADAIPENELSVSRLPPARPRTPCPRQARRRRCGRPSDHFAGFASGIVVGRSSAC